jgi:predicted PurR-regulated permease PerM
VSVSRSTDAGESAWQEGTAVPDAAREGTLLSSELDDGLLGIVSQLPVKRILIWAAFSWLVYLCRPFMGVLFGTFVVSYVGVSFCQWGTRFLRRFGIDAPRRVIVGIYYSGIALFITTMSLLTIPRIIKEGQYFVGIIRSSNPYVWIADTMRRALGDELSAKVEALVLSEGYAEPTENDGIPGAGSGSPSVAPETSDHPTDSTSGIVRIRVPLSGEIRTETGSDSLRISRNGIPSTVAAPAQWTEERSRRLGLVIQKSLSRYVNRFASIVSRILSNSTKIIVKVLLSLVFSFLIVWDLPSVAAGLRSLRRSRLRAAYLELAPAIGEFCTLLGRSFEAQSIIALVNTTLTTIGMGVLGLPGIGFLSLLCLVCSFIPLFGILLSTLPMCVVALTEYGPMRAFAVVIMVAIVHLIEAYFLNPQIYSAHLKLPPLIVLMVLYIGEHAGGVMGLILAVPLTVYLLRWIYDLPETSAKRMEKARRRSDAENGFEDRDGRLMMQPQSPES